MAKEKEADEKKAVKKIVKAAKEVATVITRGIFTKRGK